MAAPTVESSAWDWSPCTGVTLPQGDRDSTGVTLPLEHIQAVELSTPTILDSLCGGVSMISYDGGGNVAAPAPDDLVVGANESLSLIHI